MGVENFVPSFRGGKQDNFMGHLIVKDATGPFKDGESKQGKEKEDEMRCHKFI